MPSPKTIKELLKLKPCPFEDGQIITAKEFDYANDNDLIHRCLWHNAHDYVYNSFGLEWEYPYLKPFKMPDGYYHLPPNKQLGLPLGEWTFEELEPFIKTLAFGTLKEYTGKSSIAELSKGGCLLLDDLHSWHEDPWKICIKKQPPNLYNPLDPKEEMLREDNSANEEQPAKETETMELPWRDISTIEECGIGLPIFCCTDDHEDPHYYIYEKSKDIKFFKEHYNYWMLAPKLAPLPNPPAVEVPVEPGRVSVQEFAKAPLGKWFKLGRMQYRAFVEEDDYAKECISVREIIEQNDLIYATDPTAWLAHKAEQEGKN